MYHVVAYGLKSHLSRKHVPYWLCICQFKKNAYIFNLSKMWIGNSDETYKKQDPNAMIGD